MKKLIIFAFLLTLNIKLICMEETISKELSSGVETVPIVPVELKEYMLSFIKLDSLKELFKTIASISIADKEFAQKAKEAGFIENLVKQYVKNQGGMESQKIINEYIEAAAKNYRPIVEILESLGMNAHNISKDKLHLVLKKAIKNGDLSVVNVSSI